ncbi:MAG: hypothetical protein ACRDP4_06325 [Nocardioidaceae bacterium]
MSGDYGHLTDYGFTWGPMEVERSILIPEGAREITVKVNDKRRVCVYVSRTGRSVRVFKDGTELK